MVIPQPTAPGHDPLVRSTDHGPIHRDAIPAELRDLPNFVVFRVEPNLTRPKLRKTPYIPGTDEHASPTDPTHWRPLAVALGDRRLRKPGWFVGFAFPLDGALFGLDLDCCLAPETGARTPDAQALLDRFPTYAEPSCSGGGLHLIGRTDAPFDGHHRNGVEAYCRGRFFVMTARPLPGHTEIADCSAPLATWYAETFPEPGRGAVSTPPPIAPDLTDEEILDYLLTKSRNAPANRSLWDGDGGGYPSRSEAILALANKVGFYTADDEQLSRVVARSALAQAQGKWAIPGWRARTIRKARSGQTEFFCRRGGAQHAPTPNNIMVSEHLAHSASGPGDDLPDDPIVLKGMVRELGAQLATERRARQAAEQRIRDLRLRQSRIMATFRNDHLGNEKATGVGLTLELMNQQSANPDRTEFPVCADRLAEQTGQSPHTVNTHTKEKLAKVVDRRTGEVVELFERTVRQVPGELKTQTVYVPKLPPLEILDVLANAAPLSGNRKNNHGGPPTRGHCPDHPQAALVKRVTYHCAACNRIVGDEPPVIMASEQDAHSVHRPTSSPNEPAWIADAPAPDARVLVSEQDAQAGGGEWATAPPHPRVEDHSRGDNRSTRHNDQAPPGSVAAAWLHGMAPPPPIDKYTDIAARRQP